MAMYASLHMDANGSIRTEGGVLKEGTPFVRITCVYSNGTDEVTLFPGNVQNLEQIVDTCRKAIAMKEAYDQEKAKAKKEGDDEARVGDMQEEEEPSKPRSSSCLSGMATEEDA